MGNLRAYQRRLPGKLEGAPFRSPGTQQIVKGGKRRRSSRKRWTCLCRCPNNSPLNPINSSLESVGGRNNNTLPFTMRWRGCLIPRSPRPRAQGPLCCLPLSLPSPPTPCGQPLSLSFSLFSLTHSLTHSLLSLSFSFSLMSLMCRCPFVSRFICLSSPISPFPPPFLTRALFFFSR